MTGLRSTFLARDLQSVVLYDSDGNFVGVRRPGSKKAIKVNDISIVIDDIIGSSGLEMKVRRQTAEQCPSLLLQDRVLSCPSHSEFHSL